MDIAEAGHLGQLLTDRLDHRILELAGGGLLVIHLNRDLGNGDIGQQGDGQGEIGHQTQQKTGREGHEYGNGAT